MYRDFCGFNECRTDRGNVLWSGGMALAWKALQRKLQVIIIEADTIDKDTLALINNWNSAADEERMGLEKKVKESIKKILQKNVLKGLSDSEFKNSPEGKLGHI